MPVPMLVSLGSARKSAWSAWMLMGLLLSLLSAWAVAARRPQIRSRAHCLMRFGDIEALHVGPEHQAIILHVGVHAHAGHAADALGHLHRIVGARDVGVEVHRHLVRVDDERGAAVGVRPAHLHVAVQVYELAAAGFQGMVRLGEPRRVAGGEIAHARVEDLHAVVIRVMHHARRLELGGRLALQVEAGDRGVGEIVVRYVGLDALALGTLQRGLAQEPQGAGGQQRQHTQHDEETQVHASRSRAARMRSQTSRTAPRPPVAPVTKCALARTAGRALATAMANPAVPSSGRSGRSSPTQATSSGPRESFFSRRSKMGSLSSSPWNTWAIPKSCMRRATAAESRPEITATATPLFSRRFTPWPSCTWKTLSSSPP